jgi:hypothetical protein
MHETQAPVLIQVPSLIVGSTYWGMLAGAKRGQPIGVGLMLGTFTGLCVLLIVAVPW